VTAQHSLADVAQHFMIENATLGTSDQNRCTLIGNRTAAIFEALETNAIEYCLKISNLLGRQLRAHTLKSYVRQGLSSRDNAK
jgi:hypothetical protein